MDEEFTRQPGGSWSAVLPFRVPRSRLPNNQPLALKRACMLDASLKKNHMKRDHMVAFMKKIIDRGHAEVASPISIDDDRERWYLPLFGVYHPKKPGKIRGVFDSSAKFKDVSLNEVLMKGLDLTNSLLGVLLRFRKGKVAVTADIQQMFYCFSVTPEHRDVLRFYWYEANDPSRPMMEYRMTKHVFGNCPSPAVASYGLRRTAKEGEGDYGADILEFVENNFYVDDGLISLSTPDEAVDLLSRTQAALPNAGIRLHKISSNSQDVINSFPSDDLAQDLKDLDLGSESLPSQRSLGLCWNLESDTFSFKSSMESKPYTRRGVLLTINSLCDPLGFLAPVTIKGKTLLRKMVEGIVDWDEPLSADQHSEWEAWEKSLQELGSLQIPCRTPISEDDISNKVHIYADASERAIAAVEYSRQLLARKI
ncbi:uncharacterized protein LOC132557112 [Ylistrum balloti]|uniref:uncharacterized protein LOC132557112 n=1 Tax=Ylistrum balloti TaxID=509963 RepID=UPI002905F71C|nr:uncharacterized protein LOC132557112 [Ylistrum balloti]